MRKLITAINVTLDGFMAGHNGELDWHFPLWNDELSSHFTIQLNSMDTILLGRITYQAMANYWSSAPENDYSLMMNNYTKVVFSRSLKKAHWNNSKIVKKNMEKEIRKLKSEPGKNIILFGSCSILSECIKLGLIDEYHILIYPVVLGTGIPLFKQVKNSFNLEHLKTRTFSSGVVELRYETKSQISGNILN